ncbi:MAG: UDP-N-acetylmuramate:L-alanyl-gamma-D-glutamyl-meso-diaminopimelate ligase [Sulfuriflexus sp.]|nr:UDP-N-acetylmuramate:L-alanyl-gamma-D-glutamyl-meso-diaminopimelate ligase [Sulfuriflexus sp.]
MHIHILGICGTFMGGLALLARELGYEVSGSDAGVYPPMSTQLEAAGIHLHEGYTIDALEPEPDLIVIGNAMSRGNPVVEYVLDRNLPYTSGPQFLSEHVLRDRWVLAVAGTHGKTTTASMLAQILDQCGLAPGFLIGGIAEDFGISARLGNAPFFVVEADEYDTAFFDKRSKFVHYQPRTLIINNLEFDHADIFDDLAAIQKQFHHLMRIVPSNGLVIHPSGVAAIDEMLAMGCWTPCETFNADDEANWQCVDATPAFNHFEVSIEQQLAGSLQWQQAGKHNANNALAAIAAARHAGVPAAEAVKALCEFKGVKRRMELRGEVNGVRVFDDFAHHPTAIATTLQGAKQCLRHSGRLFAVLEPRSNTMRMGVHQASLADSLSGADQVFLLEPADMDWSLDGVVDSLGDKAVCFDDLDKLIAAVIDAANPYDDIVVMSNGAFGGIHEKLLVGL